MAIEQMKLLSLVGARDKEHDILQELVLCEKVHLDLENADTYGNNYILHEYEAMLPSAGRAQEENQAEIENVCRTSISQLERMAEGLELELNVVVDQIEEYTRPQALSDLKQLEDRLTPSIEAIREKKKQLERTNEVGVILGYIRKKIDFTALRNLSYIQYEIGTMSKDNSLHIKKNYENISALVFRIGEIQDSSEDIYMIFYLKELEEETSRLLKSLNWHKINIESDLEGNLETCKSNNEKKAEILKKQISILEKDLYESKLDMLKRFNKIYTRLQLELRIIELKSQTVVGNNVFILNAWIRSRDYQKLEERIAKVTDKYVMMARKPGDIGEEIMPPTLLRNNWFTKPFELIVKLYGLPSYHEIDPTPFLAITFCLMFGIMFGDIGQGFIYFLAGVGIAKKIPAAAGILKRLGISSMIFGVVYGSIFGLEDVEWLKNIALVHGGPLNTNNIMPILIAGVAFGVAVLTISFILGIINALRRHDIEGAFFGKNGVAGYLFFIGLISTVLSIMSVIPVPIILPIACMIMMLVIMVFKEPITHLIEGVRPLISGDKGSYYIESGFEGVETILSTLSNSISFIRVGAFALNHAGLFMAFKVMAEMVPSGIPEFIILVLGNVLILVLEGLVVFIQGLRLQYYEMFSKYFGGDGVAYEPLKITK
ncbi:MAG: hypothetical protein J6F30_15005 [Cellulosilyticum sp.]|nr:hypothetical protein [Cellulosilyticum sp.]